MSAETDIRNGFSLDKNGVYKYINIYHIYCSYCFFVNVMDHFIFLGSYTTDMHGRLSSSTVDV